jgi:hypothetical protein
MRKIYFLLALSLFSIFLEAEAKGKTGSEKAGGKVKVQGKKKARAQKKKKVEDSKTRLIRIDLISVGVPNRIVGIGPEVLIPTSAAALRDRFSVYGNYSPAAFVDLEASDLGDDAKANLSTFEIGINYYLSSRKGSGLYLSGSYSQFNLAVENTDISKLMSGFTGQVDTKIKQSGFNGRIGLKVGKGLYFRFEIGYTQFIDAAILELDGSVTDSTGSIKSSFDDSEVKVQSILENSFGINFPPVSINLGIGFSFLKDNNTYSSKRIKNKPVKYKSRFNF